MVPINDFVPFATGVSANVESQSDYLADPQTAIGQQPGVAKSAQNNKALRQATSIAAALAQYMANQTGNDVLDDGNQAELLATLALTFPGNTLPTQTTLTTTGTPTGYLFTCSTANATVGATYTNNTQTFTVLATLASGTMLFCSATGAPTSSGTLTKNTGAGDSTITFSAIQALATYTTPANCRFLEVEMVGGGGPGAGGNLSTDDATDGLPSIFGVNLLFAGGGVRAGTIREGVVRGNSPGPGGSASLGSGPVGIALTGGWGCPGVGGSSNFGPGGNGASTPFGGSGAGGNTNDGDIADNGDQGIDNTGAGGGGGNYFGGSGSGGGGGGGGAYIKAQINTPAATYFYAVGPGGPSSGTNGGDAGNGASGGKGVILIKEHYTG